MSRPDDYRSRIGAAHSPERNSRRERHQNRHEDNRRRPPSREKRQRSRSPRNENPRFIKNDHGRDRFSLKVFHKETDICSVKEYAIRDAQMYGFSNFYEFLRKLLESVNVSLSSKIPRGRYVEKKLSELISPVSNDEQQRISSQLNIRSPYKYLHCRIVILGLPRSIFVGNGFGNSKESALFSAAKAVIEKLHQIGFISQSLYEIVARSQVFDHNRKLPDFTKAMDCFIALEKRLTDSRGNLGRKRNICSEWPNDILDAVSQPQEIFDRIEEIFKQISIDVHGARLNNFSQKNGTEDDIERKIASQREQLIRRERERTARDMIEPLDESSLATWGAHPYEMMELTPIMSKMAVPPIGVIDPSGSRRISSTRGPVDMDIDDHPYRRGREIENERQLRLLQEREEELRRIEEATLMKRKEEELEKKIKEEEELRKKQEIEQEVQRRLQEELSKHNLAVSNLSIYPPSTFGSSLFNFNSTTPLQRNIVEPVDHEIEEIRRLVKETEDRIRTLNDPNEIARSASLGLVELGETASGMEASQRKTLINQLKIILNNQASIPDHWHASQHRPSDREHRFEPRVDLSPDEAYYNEKSNSRIQPRDRRSYRSPQRSRERSTRSGEPKWKGDRRSRRDERTSYRR